ncbi:BPSS1780 family membrane protein [Ramlibacter sp. AN1133]|uniref:BPSS1780 family membrane protein n=1 Tax=Ramlibacter sp. AN1133 TaxID=3133429 RepID=UPI0030C4F052
MKLNIVPARTGFVWVKLGMRTFLKQPLALTGLFFMYMAGVLVLSQLPFVGSVLGAMLVPAATLGLMAATAEAASGRFPMPSVLISAFRAGRQRARAMLVLGAIYTVGSMLATLLASALVGEPGAAVAADSQSPPLDARSLVALVLHTPLVILFWHSPALVHWHGIAPVKSLFFSAVACFRNLGAMLMYAVTWLGVFVVVAFVFSSVGMMLGGVAVARSVMLPTVLLLVAMFSTSLYFTFRDSFDPDDELAEPQPAPPEESAP